MSAPSLPMSVSSPAKPRSTSPGRTAQSRLPSTNTAPLTAGPSSPKAYPAAVLPDRVQPLTVIVPPDWNQALAKNDELLVALL